MLVLRYDGKCKSFAPCRGIRYQTNRFGHTFSIDWKPVTPPSISGHIEMYIVTESSTAFKFVVMSKVRNADSVFGAIRPFHTFIGNYNHRPHKIRFDAGTVKNSTVLQENLASLGIHADPAPISEP